MANYGPWQAAGEATNRATATGMGILQYQAQRRDAAEALRLRREAATREVERDRLVNRKNEIDIAESEKKTRLLPVMESFKAVGITNKNEQDYIIKYAGPYVEKSPTGQLVIQADYAQELWKRLQKDEKAGLDLAQMQGTNSALAIEKIDAALNNPEAKLKPDDKERMMAERTNHVVQMTAAENVIRKLMKGTEIKPPAETPEQKLERDKALALYKETIKDPTGQAIKTFETQHYGKEVPELRGTDEYITKLYAAKRAGAANINIQTEKFDIQKKATVGESRTGLTANKDDNSYFEANASIFNSLNEQNEIAYWDKSDKTGIKGALHDEETKIIKLSLAAIDAGWTPKTIQDAANAKGKTVQEVLKEIGIIK